ncbi:hypothetical protein PQR71_07575 [Paraburkholderia fungorum]|uniref:hypothetical protein n=1 Tax=Paraburkholderia fungorum TaxID=134537 RepID=UPI0038B832F5
MFQKKNLEVPAPLDLGEQEVDMLSHGLEIFVVCTNADNIWQSECTAVLRPALDPQAEVVGVNSTARRVSSIGLDDYTQSSLKRLQFACGRLRSKQREVWRIEQHHVLRPVL